VKVVPAQGELGSRWASGTKLDSATISEALSTNHTVGPPTRSPRARTQSPMAVCVQVCTTHPTSDSAPLQLVFPDAEVYWPPLGKLSLALHSVFGAYVQVRCARVALCCAAVSRRMAEVRGAAAGVVCMRAFRQLFRQPGR
jgi:hypothetical protein